MSFSGPTNFPTGAGPTSVATSDFNGDSRPDLAVANRDSTNVSILLGNGSGGFTGPTNFAAGDAPRAIAVGDFNGDSDPDLAVANYFSHDVSILLGDGSGGFTSPTNFAAGRYPISVAAGDFNGDSRSDLSVANSGASSPPKDVSILLGDGSGGFTAPTNYAVGGFTSSVVVGDFNGDSRPDLAVGNSSSGVNQVSILLGNGTGGFTGPTTFAVGGAPNWVAVGDFNGDSRADLATANYSYQNVSILLGDGSGGFTGPTNFAVDAYAFSVAVGDFSGDSRPDLVTANYSSNNVSVLLGNGSGGFTGPTNFAAGSFPFSAAVGEFNGDSRPDIAVSNYSSNNVSVLLNTTTNYVRPRGATPLRASLVVAYKACTASSPPNRTHGPPLDYDSCSPPVQSSSNLTVGTPDAGGANASSVGSVRLDVRPGDSSPGDQADVRIGVSITDVRCQSGVSTCGPANTPGGADYTGEVQASAALRVTDKYNGLVAGGGTDAATGSNTTFQVTVPCGASPTPATVGSTCEITTTADAVYGDSSTVKEGVRAIWELGQVAVYDGGSDGLVSTPGNSLFEVQGVFVP